jgi:signal transduction histidine kinase
MTVTETPLAPGAPLDAGDPAQLARRIVELESRVAELESRVRASEIERDELARACRDAEDAVRAGEEILAAATHDLRNPLGTIVMGASTLLQADPSDPKAQRVRTVAERIHRQAERMARQIRDLADFAEIQAGRIELDRGSHAPAALVDAAGALVGPIAQERGVSFEARTVADLPDVACDAERVVQVLSNLVANAVKVTARGGVIEIGARPAGNRVVFLVRDSGPGLDGEELSAMFRPGWRSKHASYRGTGLGFTIARGIVDAHGGQIWAEGAPGRGNTVYFSLTPPRN